MSEVTRILSAIESGDPSASEKLLPLVYDELRKLAAQKMAQEAPGQTLQATALVHEAYLRLVASGGRQSPESLVPNSRGLSPPARRNSRIAATSLPPRPRPCVASWSKTLVARIASNTGAKRERVDLESLEVAAPERNDELLALDEALGILAESDPHAAELVKLRYFAGLTIREAAEVLGMSPRTADFLWAYAKSWLLQKLEGDRTP